MNRRRFLKEAGAFPLVASAWPGLLARAVGARAQTSRVRPGDEGWPSPAQWAELKEKVGGRLLQGQPPFAACLPNSDVPACQDALKSLQNPYYIGDQPSGTQSTGWFNAWLAAPSAYVVAANCTADVVAAVNFARTSRLRLVVKGGGHSYQGTSNAAGSLLIWTRGMDTITLHDAFVPKGCPGPLKPQPAVSVGAGAMWFHTYDAVTTKAGRYVQGGGCATVGVAGLVQSGGFGNFSKNFGTAAANLLEAEVVTADGAVRIANACTHPDLFGALKGGGGGTFAVVTRVTLRTHDLPATFGRVQLTVKANSDEAFRRLTHRFVSFYADHLFNRHWGESITLRPGNSLGVSMVFSDLSAEQATGLWQPLFDWLHDSPQDFTLGADLRIGAVPARHYWDADFLREHVPGRLRSDERPGAASNNVWSAGDSGQIGLFWYGYTSTWMPERLLKKQEQGQLSETLFAASRHWEVELHFNKGLAGAPAAALAAARDTATNPAVLSAFALAIIGGGGPPVYPGVPGHSFDEAAARTGAASIGQATRELRKLVPKAGSYVSESDYFESAWQEAFWGPHYRRLRLVKDKYDPEGLFFVHHGVGSEDWSSDGFTRLAVR